MKHRKPTTPKEEPKVNETPAPSIYEYAESIRKHLATRPTWEPFESCKQADGSFITTWKHPDGQTEQWHGDKRVYGPVSE